jgi:LPS sulfotransferase NodH
MADATPWAARSTSRLVVLLSSERSGSTLLRVMLGAHTRICAPQELFLLRYPTFDAWRAQKPDAMESVMELCFLLGQPRTEADIEAACRGRAIADV